MSADRPAGAAGEDSDEYSEATDDQKRDEERAQRKHRRARYKKELPHSFRVLRPKDFLKTVLKAVLRPEDFLKTVLKAVLRPAFC